MAPIPFGVASGTGARNPKMVQRPVASLAEAIPTAAPMKTSLTQCWLSYTRDSAGRRRQGIQPAVAHGRCIFLRQGRCEGKGHRRVSRPQGGIAAAGIEVARLFRLVGSLHAQGVLEDAGDERRRRRTDAPIRSPE